MSTVIVSSATCASYSSDLFHYICTHRGIKKSNINYSYKKKINYLKYWEQEKGTPTNNTYSNTNKNDEDDDNTSLYIIGGIIVAAIIEYILYGTFWIIGIIFAIIVLLAG